METPCHPTDVICQTVELLNEAVRSGVTEFCLCPGARNSPFVSILKRQPGLVCWYWFEERSAAFFAIGRSRITSKPVAVITTSGTAAGELLPAAMEAFYTNTPLLLITADRPLRFRGSGAPQSAEQKGLFGCYAPYAQDLDGESTPDLSLWSKRAPAHLNVCLEEPPKGAVPYIPKLEIAQGEPARIDERTTNRLSEELDDFLVSVKAPLVIVSSLPLEDLVAVLTFLLRLNCPVILEGTSGLREDPRLSGLRIYRNDRIWEAAERNGYPIDGVLRIGGVPTIRLWRDLEDRPFMKVCSITHLPFSGLSGRQCTSVELRLLFFYHPIRSREACISPAAWYREDKEFQVKAYALYKQFPKAEPSLVHQLSKLIPAGSSIYLGNSLPIREWDFAAQDSGKEFIVSASRGVNGIDGQLSTFLGLCEPVRENWGLFGDLTTLYDMAAPWILQQMDQYPIRFVVINNGGGKIFERMFADVEMQNRHALSFEAFARFWGVGYEKWYSIPDEYPRSNHVLIELIPDEKETQAFWTAHNMSTTS
jgi:2-succinyl-5-enolpyruvyl-6-hydroxy-3-cyclohexene-1-carboxylate synthase